MKGTKRGSKKVKALPMAVNLAACLRLYAPNEKTHMDALRRARNENEGASQAANAGMKPVNKS